MRLRSFSLNLFVPLAAALGVGLVGCGDTVVPALDEAERRLESGDSGDGVVDGGGEVADTCFLNMLYKVEGDQYWVKGGGHGPIVPRSAGSGDPCEAFGAANGVSAEACQHVDGNDGHAKIRWNNEVVAEVTIGETFFTSGRAAVITYDAGAAGYFEYRLSTRRSCDSSLPIGPVLTRAEVAELEEGAR